MIRSTKIARLVTGEKQLITNATFNGKTLKLKSFVQNNTNNLFSTDWMTQFQFWDLPLNSYYQKFENLSTEAEILKKS